MNINVQYEPTAQELAKACSLFVEKKTFLSFMVGLINIVAFLLLCIMFLKLYFVGLLPTEWLGLLGGLAWLFGRRPFNEWLLSKRMQKSPVIGKTINVEISRNGIVWSGQGLRAGNLPWQLLKYVLLAQNGFVLPNNLTQFLWLPFRGFTSPMEIEALKNLLQEKNIPLKKYPRWRC